MLICCEPYKLINLSTAYNNTLKHSSPKTLKPFSPKPIKHNLIA